MVSVEQIALATAFNRNILRPSPIVLVERAGEIVTHQDEPFPCSCEPGVSSAAE